MNQAALPQESREAKILADQANAVQRNVPGLIAGNVVMACICAWLFRDGASPALLWLWFGAQLLLSAVSLAQALRIRKRPARPRNAVRRLRANTIGITVDGLLWMLGVLAFWPSGQLEAQWLLSLVLLGTVAGALHGLNAWLPAFYGYYLPCVAGVIGAAVWEGTGVSLAFALATAIFGATSARFATLMHGTLLESLRARYEVAELAADLAVQKERAEEANRAKSRFLAAASHDLRQPVHALTLFVDALAAQPPGPEADRMLARVSATVGSMGEMFDALLDVSKLDAGVVTVEPRRFDLKAMVEKVCEQEAPLAVSRGIALRVNARAVSVGTDPLLLERILRNLMVNALRYTERGGILVTVRRRGEDAVLRVVDTGIGIAPERQGEVFEEFVQLHNPERDRNKGLGLGLAIVRRLAGLLEIRLSLRSRPGRGTSFTLRLPAAEGGAEANPPGALVIATRAGQESGSLLLVIDDDADVRAGMCALLAGWGHRVIDAAGITDLMPRLRSVQQVPALILCDYRLRGEETGAQVIEHLRFEYNDDIPAILVTGDTAPERLLEASESGHLLLHKPVPPKVLRERIAAAIANAAEDSAQPD